MNKSYKKMHIDAYQVMEKFSTLLFFIGESDDLNSVLTLFRVDLPMEIRQQIFRQDYETARSLINQYFNAMLKRYTLPQLRAILCQKITKMLSMLSIDVDNSIEKYAKKRKLSKPTDPCSNLRRFEMTSILKFVDRTITNQNQLHDNNVPHSLQMRMLRFGLTQKHEMFHFLQDIQYQITRKKISYSELKEIMMFFCANKININMENFTEQSPELLAILVECIRCDGRLFFTLANTYVRLPIIQDALFQTQLLPNPEENIPIFPSVLRTIDELTTTGSDLRTAYQLYKILLYVLGDRADYWKRESTSPFRLIMNVP
jgi:hypothetical protein